MTVYIQRRSINHNYLETVDEFETRKEANAMLREYQLCDHQRWPTIPCRALH